MAANAIGAAVIIEIARSEGGTNAYCGINFLNISRVVDAICNELWIMIPVAVHADHFGIKHLNQIPQAKIEIPSLFNSGITSIAIDASHLPDDENLITNIELAPFILEWAGFETEIGEIKGTIGMSTPEEALFLISGLNARGIFPDFLASNNGSKHGIEKSALGINVNLTAEILFALESFLISGAQHGTSGNDSNRLRSIAATLTPPRQMLQQLFRWFPGVSKLTILATVFLKTTCL